MRRRFIPGQNVYVRPENSARVVVARFIAYQDWAANPAFPGYEMAQVNVRKADGQDSIIDLLITIDLIYETEKEAFKAILEGS